MLYDNHVLQIGGQLVPAFSSNSPHLVRLCPTRLTEPHPQPKTHLQQTHDAAGFDDPLKIRHIAPLALQQQWKRITSAASELAQEPDRIKTRDL